MKPVTIITGKQGSGKTTKTKELCQGKKSKWINSLENQSIKELFIDTDVIVIEELATKKDLKNVKKLINTKSLGIRKPYSEFETETERPELIICTHAFSNEDFSDNQNDIRFIKL